MNRLKNKVAIITGGATGIGEAISRKFLKEGARILIAGLPEDPVSELVDQLSSGQARGFTGDLADEEDAQACIEKAVDEFGQIDILINNAGIFPEVSVMEEYSVDAFDNMIRNNLRTTFLMTRYALPYLKNTRGCIVAAGSEAGKIGIAQNAPYGGTKGFIHSFIRGVAVEQAKNGIRANCVCPGAIDTAWTHKETGPMDEDMEDSITGSTPLGRRGTPEEIANAYLFLASDEASFVTGALFSVDGGITISKGLVGDDVPEELKELPEGELSTSFSMEGATEKR